MSKLRRCLITITGFGPISFAYRVSEESNTINAPLQERILLSAMGFISGGMRMHAQIDNQDGSTNSPTQPLIAMYTLATELSFKALLQECNGTFKKIHDLKKLYADLPVSHQIAIREAYESYYETIFPQASQQVVHQTLLQKSIIVKLYYPFDELITLIGSYFEKSRYDFEDRIENYVEFPIEVLAQSTYKYTAQVLGDLDKFKFSDAIT